MFLYTIVFFGTTQCHQESRHTQRDDERRFVVRESLPRPPGAQERHPCTHVRRDAWCAQKPVKCFFAKKAVVAELCSTARRTLSGQSRTVGTRLVPARAEQREI